MNQENNEQTELLRNIWNEIKSVNQNLSSRIDQTNERLDLMNKELRGEIASSKIDLGRRIDQTNERLDSVRSELITRMTESEIRLATATNELALNVRSLSGIISEWRKEHRASTEQISQRVTRLEEWREQVETHQ
jgi:predicted  nucleic acid-binding Zn-ribbon protein